MSTIDLNVDIGEGGAHDEALLDYATSANIACGWHAGDAITMRRTAMAVFARDIAIGAHPSYPDRENFGRRSMELDSGELYAGIQYQVGALAGIVTALGTRLSHVKPHGAMYNDAERNRAIAEVIVDAVRDFDSSLAIYGLSGGRLVAAARRAGLVALDEAFVDRGYCDDGTLIPRWESGGLIDDPQEIGRRAVNLAKNGRAKLRDEEWIAIRAETLCLHGDGARALEIADAVRSSLQSASIGMKVWR
ncbi:TPA: 5-oxoprolinase subunit PxpA [Burkholderia orbicola]|nr:LamB/YcsF family protein [Burkholderia cenocepacia]